MTKLLILACVCGAVALFRWLNNRPVSRTQLEVIDLIERTINKGGDRVWDEFVSVRIQDPELEAVRKKCLAINLESKEIFNEKLRQILVELRTAS